MFFEVSLQIAIIVNAVAIVANGILCFVNSNYRVMEQLKAITVQCRWVSVLYFIFSWFMGDGNLVDSSLADFRITTYDLVVRWLLVSAIGWLLVFIFILISGLWNREDKLSSEALIMGTIYFVLAYLLH